MENRSRWFSQIIIFFKGKLFTYKKPPCFLFTYLTPWAGSSFDLYPVPKWEQLNGTSCLFKCDSSVYLFM